MQLTSIQWTLACAVLNTAALLVVGLLSVFTTLPFGVATSIGSSFVIASAWPFHKAKQALAAENNNGAKA